MQVHLLLAELKRFAPFSEGDDLETKHRFIKGAGSLNVLDGQHQMIDAVNLRCGTHYRLLPL